MKPVVAVLIALVIWAPGCSTVRPGTETAILTDPQPLPLALDDSFEFRKIQQIFVSPEPLPARTDRAVLFERQRILHGAVSESERRERYGNYYRFFWRAERPSDITIRLEYRQANLGEYVQAREMQYAAAEGSIKSEFAIIGDDFERDGRVTAWRVLLIENGVVRALEQSFLWK